MSARVGWVCWVLFPPKDFLNLISFTLWSFSCFFFLNLLSLLCLLSSIAVDRIGFLSLLTQASIHTNIFRNTEKIRQIWTKQHWHVWVYMYAWKLLQIIYISVGDKSPEDVSICLYDTLKRKRRATMRLFKMLCGKQPDDTEVSWQRRAYGKTQTWPHLNSSLVPAALHTHTLIYFSINRVSG